MPIFYRVANIQDQKGLWYDYSGNFTGLIHNELSFCKASKLEMPFDEEMIGWLSATSSIKELFQWFPIEDILKLQKFGWRLVAYEAEDFKTYDLFNHPVINQQTSKIIREYFFEENHKNMKNINGDLVHLALTGEFDVIAHGCNCFCTMGAGISKPMSQYFQCNMYKKEMSDCGNMNKLGTIDFGIHSLKPKYFVSQNIEDYEEGDLIVVNAYTQFTPGKDFRADALRSCMKLMNEQFKGLRIGLPLIGAGIAGGNWEEIKQIVKEELVDCDVTIVHYVPNTK